MLTWTTPAPNVPGHAWCVECAGPPDTGTVPAPAPLPVEGRRRRRVKGRQQDCPVQNPARK
eukprot:14267266-Heterocapsa_arctica.AAC.1